MSLTKLNTFFKTRPLLVSLLGNTVKTASADIITQKYIDEKEHLDMRRLAVFTTFGCVYLGGWQYFLFNKLFVRCERAMAVAKLKPLMRSSILTFLDLGVHTPLMYYPCFYGIKSNLEGKDINHTLSTYKTNIYNDMLAMWKIWIPAQLTNFLLVPLHMRMPYITSVSFGWTIILSMMRGGNQH